VPEDRQQKNDRERNPEKPQQQASTEGHIHTPLRWCIGLRT
jgi:hypothetical protein